MIEPLDIAAAHYIAERMREIDWREVSATAWHDSRAAFAAECLRWPGPKFVVRTGAEVPVVMGGLALHTPGVATAWAVGTDNWRRVAVEATRYARQAVEQLLADGVVHRVQALSAVFHEPSHRWLRLCGLRRESTVVAYGRNREDFYMYAITGPSDVRR